MLEVVAGLVLILGALRLGRLTGRDESLWRADVTTYPPLPLDFVNPLSIYNDEGDLILRYQNTGASRA